MQPRSALTTKKIRESRYIAALFVCIGIALTACTRPASSFTFDEQQQWRDGDLVFRCGWGAESRMVTARSQSSYSHVGILYWDSATGAWHVVHAVPGEDEAEYVKSEPVGVFFSAERARCGAWARVACEDSIAAKAVGYALAKAAQHVEFDNEYLLNDSTQLYCTELVWRAYQSQGIDISDGNRHSVPTLFSKEGEGIFPIDIEESKTTLFVNPLKN